MIYNFKKIILSILILAGTKGFAYTELGNGLGGLPFHNNLTSAPWFLSKYDRPVEVCVRGFQEGVISATQFSKMIERAFEYWKQEARLDEKTKALLPSRAFVTFNCTEDFSTLMIEIIHERESFTANSTLLMSSLSGRLAEAVLRYPDSIAPWKSGTIRIAGPKLDICTRFQGHFCKRQRLDWTSREKIARILYHEIGHVMGMEHTESNDIMDPQFLMYFLFDVPLRENVLRDY